LVVGCDVLHGIHDDAVDHLALAVLRPHIAHHIHLERGFRLILRLEEELAKVLGPPGAGDSAAQFNGQALDVPVYLRQGLVVEGEQVQVMAEAMVQVKGCQRRPTGQEEPRAEVQAEEAVQERALQGWQELVSHGGPTGPGHTPIARGRAASGSGGGASSPARRPR